MKTESLFIKAMVQEALSNANPKDKDTVMASILYTLVYTLTNKCEISERNSEAARLLDKVIQLLEYETVMKGDL